MDLVVATVLALWTVVFVAAAFLPAVLDRLGRRRTA